MQYEIGKELHKLNTRVCRILEKNCPEDDMPYLTGANGRIICYLWEHQNEEIYQKDLEKEFGINRSTASREVGLMEKKGILFSYLKRMRENIE